MLNLKIKYMHDDTKRLTIYPNGDWIDLYADEDKIIEYGQQAYVKLGFAMQLPEGYEAHVAPRSSSFKNWGFIIANSVGVIDESYCGDDDEWCASVLSLSNKTLYTTDDNGKKIEVKGTHIHRGDKIAQFRIIEKMPPVQFVEVESLGNKNRGGLGSTGIK